jgi:hypothetical protein
VRFLILHQKKNKKIRNLKKKIFFLFMCFDLMFDQKLEIKYKSGKQQHHKNKESLIFFTRKISFFIFGKIK